MTTNNFDYELCPALRQQPHDARTPPGPCVPLPSRPEICGYCDQPIDRGKPIACRLRPAPPPGAPAGPCEPGIRGRPNDCVWCHRTLPDCSAPGAAGPCMPRNADGRCIWCERELAPGWPGIGRQAQRPCPARSAYAGSPCVEAIGRPRVCLHCNAPMPDDWHPHLQALTAAPPTDLELDQWFKDAGEWANEKHTGSLGESWTSARRTYSLIAEVRKLRAYASLKTKLDALPIGPLHLQNGRPRIALPQPPIRNPKPATTMTTDERETPLLRQRNEPPHYWTNERPPTDVELDKWKTIAVEHLERPTFHPGTAAHETIERLAGYALSATLETLRLRASVRQMVERVEREEAERPKCTPPTEAESAASDAHADACERD